MNQKNKNPNFSLSKLFIKAKQLKLSPAEKQAGWVHIKKRISTLDQKGGEKLKTEPKISIHAKMGAAAHRSHSNLKPLSK